MPNILMEFPILHSYRNIGQSKQFLRYVDTTIITL